VARLNVQGLARRDAGLLACLVPDDGYVTVSMDLAAGEPTVTSHYSQDRRYRYATFDGVGRAPFYDGPVLMLDDLYLMTMSVSPIGAQQIRDVFNNHRFNGLTFVEQWLLDPEVIKSFFKKQRQLHKMLCLALGYGMRPKKMVKQCYDNGYTMDIRTAQAFYDAYWDLFEGVRRLSDRLAAQVRKNGYIVNPFGYRLTPPPHKGFNYFIQSSVSGILHVFNAKIFAAAPYARFITVIHDELVVDCPEDRLEHFRQVKELATDSLNKDLGWSVAVRTGFVAGRSWYEAK
jgi:hypothetical protein